MNRIPIDPFIDEGAWLKLTTKVLCIHLASGRLTDAQNDAGETCSPPNIMSKPTLWPTPQRAPTMNAREPPVADKVTIALQTCCGFGSEIHLHIPCDATRKQAHGTLEGSIWLVCRTFPCGTGHHTCTWAWSYGQKIWDQDIRYVVRPGEYVQDAKESPISHQG
jgi:hypothetical protein